jgi:hypothetical protein
LGQFLGGVDAIRRISSRLIDIASTLLARSPVGTATNLPDGPTSRSRRKPSQTIYVKQPWSRITSLCYLCAPALKFLDPADGMAKWLNPASSELPDVDM